MKIFFTVFVILTGARKSLIFVVFGLVLYPYFIGGEKGMDAKKIGRIFFGIALFVVLCYLLMNNETLYNVIG